MSTQPAAVLVHGAFADASGVRRRDWRRGGAGSGREGADEPLRGLASDAGAIRRYTTTIEGPIVLVGHSCGGPVISQAADVAELIEKAAESVGAAVR